MFASKDKVVDIEQVNLLADQLVLLNPKNDLDEIHRIKSKLRDSMLNFIGIEYESMEDITKRKYLDSMKVFPKSSELEGNNKMTEMGRQTFIKRNSAAKKAFAGWLEESYCIPYLVSVMKKYKTYVPFVHIEEMLECMEEVLAYNPVKNSWNYNPESSLFIPYFMRTLSYKTMHSQDKLYRANYLEEVSIYEEFEYGEDSANTNTILDTYQDENGMEVEDIVMDNLYEEKVQENRELSYFVQRFLMIMHELDLYMKSLSKKRGITDIFKSFTTYDICLLLRGEHSYYKKYQKEYTIHYKSEGITSEDMKKDMVQDLIQTLLGYNEQIYPKLFQKLLHFLMYGDFDSLLDVIKNQLREEINLLQRRKIIASCNGTTEVTVTEYTDKYQKFVKKLMTSEKFRLGEG